LEKDLLPVERKKLQDERKLTRLKFNAGEKTERFWRSGGKIIKVVDKIVGMEYWRDRLNVN